MRFPHSLPERRRHLESGERSPVSRFLILSGSDCAFMACQVGTAAPEAMELRALSAPATRSVGCSVPLPLALGKGPCSHGGEKRLPLLHTGQGLPRPAPPAGLVLLIHSVRAGRLGMGRQQAAALCIHSPAGPFSTPSAGPAGGGDWSDACASAVKRGPTGG